MTDVESKRHVEWWVDAGAISDHKTERKVGHLGLDTEHKDGMRVFKDRKTLYDLKDGKLRKYGKAVASYDDSSVTFGKRVYTFSFEDAGDWYDFPSWKVTVKRGDTVVIESKQAAALCAAAGVKARTGKPMPAPDQIEEIRRRIMFYLAWREVGV